MDLPLNGLCIRKVGNTIQESVYEQLKEATYLLDVFDEFVFTKSPLRVIYKARGNYIIFRGADDAQKLKSIKTSNFPIARVWIEELTEFKTEEELQTIMDSVLRAELPENLTYKFFYSYNPPKRKQHWVNKKYESVIIPKNTYIHHSSYLDNPYLPFQTLEEINEVKEKNIRKYNWIYLGEPTGGGIVPFENLNFRKITDDEIRSFNNIRQGMDWGYAAHPFCFARFHLDKKKEILYLFDEVFGVGLSNRKAAESINAKKYNDEWITADSAEPKSIAEMKEYSLRVKGAIKGPGSVEYGEKWLNDLTEIVIDPDRCPNCAKQFEDIDYKVDRDGNIKSELEDVENEAIDVARYACEGDMRKNKIEFF
jgi:PBSX family phage terminase large subunit